MAESIKLKEILHLMKLRVLLYGWPFLREETCESREAHRGRRTLWNVEVTSRWNVAVSRLRA